ncbi:MAG: DUF120 domain-containing protein [Candidatus Altiarchaeota archaeon]
MRNFKNYNKKNKIVIEGFVKSGLGEGAYYIKIYSEKLRDKLHFTPYLGTLNIKVCSSENLKKFVTFSIAPFSENGKFFGKASLIPAKISKDLMSEKCYIIIPEITQHKNEIELISKKNLRKALKLKNNDKVKIEISLD